MSETARATSAVEDIAPVQESVIIEEPVTEDIVVESTTEE